MDRIQKTGRDTGIRFSQHMCDGMNNSGFESGEYEIMASRFEGHI